MTCKENLAKCKASCCRYIVFDRPFITKDMAEYYVAHGCRVEQKPNRQWVIVVPMKCPQLGDDNLCKIHNNKPKLCLDLNGKTKRNYYLTEGCIYK